MKISVACIAIMNGKLFIAKRIDSGDMGGRWEFPGGKVEEGECITDAIKRELKEEFSIDVEVGEHITDAYFEHRGQKRELQAYSVIFPHDGIETPYVLTEHTQYKWIEDAEEIENLKFVDSDMIIYPKVVEYFNKVKNAENEK